MPPVPITAAPSPPSPPTVAAEAIAGSADASAAEMGKGGGHFAQLLRGEVLLAGAGPAAAAAATSRSAGAIAPASPALASPPPASPARAAPAAAKPGAADKPVAARKRDAAARPDALVRGRSNTTAPVASGPPPAAGAPASITLALAPAMPALPASVAWSDADTTGDATGDATGGASAATTPAAQGGLPDAIGTRAPRRAADASSPQPPVTPDSAHDPFAATRAGVGIATDALPSPAAAPGAVLSRLLAEAAGGSAAILATIPHPAPPGSGPAAVALAVASAAAPSSVASAAGQILPVLVRLVTAGGSQQVTLSLHPLDLGQVQVRIERDPSGSVQIAVLAERPETLHALQRDQEQLGRALERAGLPAEARTVTFQLALVPVVAASDAVLPPGAAQSGSALPEPGGDMPHDPAAAGGGPGFERGGSQQQPAQHGGTGLAAPGTVAVGPEAGRWTRFGIDITA